MANPSGRKGADWEQKVADYLKEEFPMVERRVKNGPPRQRRHHRASPTW